MSSKTRSGHTVIKVSLPQDEVLPFKHFCLDQGTSMSDFARSAIQASLRASANPFKLPVGANVFADAVEAAARASAGIPRTQLEAITAAVVIALNEKTSV
jgi:hypothetical protein